MLEEEIHPREIEHDGVNDMVMREFSNHLNQTAIIEHHPIIIHLGGSLVHKDITETRHYTYSTCTHHF
jgi:hypothetical protein